MEGIRLPSNFTFDSDLNGKRERQAQAATDREANKKRLMEALGVHAKSPNICKRYRQGRCTRHLFGLFERPADESCEFTHGTLEQTMQIPCKLQHGCTDLGCPYLHQPERQAKALDEAGKLRSAAQPTSEP
jgi:hypothetical protein